MKRTIALYALALAGVAWGVYSVLGKTEAEPATATARNFILSVPFAALLFLTPRASFHAEPEGVALAVASGALASGLGYVIWYAALRGLTNMAAAVVQLAVPVVAAAGGVLFFGRSRDGAPRRRFGAHSGRRFRHHKGESSKAVAADRLTAPASIRCSSIRKIRRWSGSV